jgi:hypothetical protein
MLTVLSDMFTFNLASICCSQGLNFLSFFKHKWVEKSMFKESIYPHCCHELLHEETAHTINWFLRWEWCWDSWCWDSCICWCDWCEISSVCHEGVKIICMILHVLHFLSLQLFMLCSSVISIWAQEEILSATVFTSSVIEVSALILHWFQQLYSKVLSVDQI